MKNGNLPRYEVVVYWDDDDQIYIAEVPDLAGCAAHGGTQVEAVQNVSDAVALWIETAKEFGDPIPSPSEHRVAA